MTNNQLSLYTDLDAPADFWPVGSSDVTVLGKMIVAVDSGPWMVGEWDERGRFHLTYGRASCCAMIRTPSAGWPWSEYRHRRTNKHRRVWLAENDGLTSQQSENGS